MGLNYNNPADARFQARYAVGRWRVRGATVNGIAPCDNEAHRVVYGMGQHPKLKGTVEFTASCKLYGPLHLIDLTL